MKEIEDRVLPDEIPETMSARQLITLLDRAFPRPLPAPRDPINGVMFDSGRRHLVETLLYRLRGDS